jgi:hypothetical protein
VKDPEARLSLFHQSLNDLVGYATSQKKIFPHEKHYTFMGGDCWNASIGTKNSEIENVRKC